MTRFNTDEQAGGYEEPMAKEAQTLKACPFCGGKADDGFGAGTHPMTQWVGCLDCDAVSPHLGDLAESIKEWNTRAPDPALTEALAIIEKQREALEDVLKALPISQVLDAECKTSDKDEILSWLEDVAEKVEQALALTDGDE